ncbi:MAG: tetratricopeptide repeat protein, partial [Phycisphaerae bacterium]
MESTTVQAVNLFEGEIPPLQQLLKLAQTVHSSELSRLDFTEKVQSFLSKTGQDAVLACGIGLVIIGRYKEAVEKLNNAKDCAQKFAFLAIALKNRGKFKEAVEAAEKAAGLNDCEKWAMLFIATTYSEQKRHDEADKIIKKLEEKFQNDDQVQCSKAWANETRGLYSRACECYQDALQRNQNNQLAMFRLAYLADILGDDEAAIDYYKKLLELKPNYINALINLAVIYEDNLQFKKAENCINKVLQYFPNHQKARMLKKDIEAAITMCYDEESEKKRSRRNQLLDTPISDFELSVRS